MINKKIQTLLTISAIASTSSLAIYHPSPQNNILLNKFNNSTIIATNQNLNTSKTEHILGVKDTIVKVIQDNNKIYYYSATGNLVGNKIDTKIPKLPKDYKIVKITMNGKEISQNEVPTIQGNDNQIIIYTIRKMSTDIVKVVYEDGKIAQPSVSVTGVTDSKTGLNVPTIPEGYHVISITNSTKGVDGLPKTFGNTDNTTTYTIAKNIVDKTYAKVITTKGDILVPSTEVGNGAPNSKEDIITPNVPKGYEIIKVTINGEKVTANKDGKYDVTYNSNENKNIDNHIVITVKQIPVKDTVKVVYEDGKIAQPSVSVTGVTDSKTGLNVPTIPEGYHVISITNSTKGVDGLPKTFGNTDNTTTYTIAKNIVDKTYAKVITTKGDILVPSTEVGNGAPNSKEDIITPNVPKGYEIIKVTINGEKVTANKDGKYDVTYNSNENKNIDNHIVITVKSKLVNNTTKVEIPNVDKGISTSGTPVEHTITKNMVANSASDKNSTLKQINSLPDTGLNMQNTNKLATETGTILSILALISGLFFFKKKR